MTSDATHSIQAAPVPDGLRDVITGARCLLLGFDGPLCRLFPGHRARRVADGLIDRLKERGHQVPLTEDERTAEGGAGGGRGRAPPRPPARAAGRRPAAAPPAPP
ncbi:hypothetical protein ACWGH9_20200, partial [Streptomyces chryseus]